jgi:hypothetical protein
VLQEEIIKADFMVPSNKQVTFFSHTSLTSCAFLNVCHSVDVTLKKQCLVFDQQLHNQLFVSLFAGLE